MYSTTQFRCPRCGRGMSRSFYQGAAAGPSWGEPEEDPEPEEYDDPETVPSPEEGGYDENDDEYEDSRNEFEDDN